MNMVPDWELITTLITGLGTIAGLVFMAIKLGGERQLLSAQAFGAQAAANYDEVRTMEIVARALEVQNAQKDVAVAKLEATQSRLERQIHEDALKHSKEIEAIKLAHATEIEARDKERGALNERVNRLDVELGAERKERMKLEQALENEKKAREALERRLQEAEAENAKLRKLLEDKDVLISDLRGEVNALKEAQSGEKAA